VQAALMSDLVCPTCSSLSCWVALTCSACASVGPLQPQRLPLIHLLPHSFPLMRDNASVHNSCAPKVYPQPKCEIVASFFGLPISLLLAASSASTLSLFRLCFLVWTVALLLGCRRGLLSRIPPWGQPVMGLGLLLRLRLRLPGTVG